LAPWGFPGARAMQRRQNNTGEFGWLENFPGPSVRSMLPR
jgi:hypothetical protein